MEPEEHFNLIYGDNASGKTSLLEALAYLGRGKSFRGAATPSLIRHGASNFVLVGKLKRDEIVVSLGASNGPDGLEVSAAGERGGGAAVLATTMPLQVVDPEVHSLVAGGPEERRRYLDWLVFHVEPGYLTDWRRFRRALKQRNAALKTGGSADELDGWDKELSDCGAVVDAAREGVFEIAEPHLRDVAESLLQCEIGFEYRRGWPQGQSLHETLRDGRARDLQLGSTQAGPHRCDIVLAYEQRRARRLVSRGQQKLLACALILGATDVAQTFLERPLLLLLDDPAAELDAASLDRLMKLVVGLGSQVVATSLQPVAQLFPQQPSMFHVERGVLKKVD